MSQNNQKQSKDNGNDSDYSLVFATFARYFGYTPTQIGNLTPTQILLMQKGLNTLLRLESGAESIEEQEKRKRKIEEMKDQEIAKNIKRMREKGKKQISLEELFGAFKTI